MVRCSSSSSSSFAASCAGRMGSGVGWGAGFGGGVAAPASSAGEAGPAVPLPAEGSSTPGNADVRRARISWVSGTTHPPRWASHRRSRSSRRLRMAGVARPRRRTRSWVGERRVTATPASRRRGGDISGRRAPGGEGAERFMGRPGRRRRWDFQILFRQAWRLHGTMGRRAFGGVPSSPAGLDPPTPSSSPRTSRNRRRGRDGTSKGRDGAEEQ